jgi:hypothetical protein
VVNNEAQLPGCGSIALPVDADQVEAIHPLAATSSVGHTILVQGSDNGGRFAISGITLPPARPQPEPPAPMPLHQNLLAAMQARPFGVEERIRASLVNGRLQVDCAPGDKPAGVLLSGPWYLPRANVALQLAYSGNGAFRWQAADAALAGREKALEMGTIEASGLPGSGRFGLPAALDRATWKQFALVCPANAARLELTSLTLLPAAARVPRRSTWVWNPVDWREPGALFDWARRNGVSQLFVVVPLDGDKVRDPAALAAFVRRARRANIEVWSVDGDPRMVLPAERAATVRRVRAYAAYNASVGRAERLAGMQFDVEPYLLPGYDAAADEWDRRYVELAAALRRAAGTLRLEFVVPYWWAPKSGLLHALAGSADSLAVMDYRTAPDEIYRFAAPFLDWAERHGKRVRIALEAGPVAAETQRRYLRAGDGAPGELLLVHVAGQPVLVLLKEPVANPGAQAFRLHSTNRFDGSATSFHGRTAELLRRLPQLERDFAAWRGFAGIALHELRQSDGTMQR